MSANKKVQKNTAKKTTPSNTLPWKNSVIAGILFICAFLLYGNTLGHDYALDDDIYTRKNTYIQQGFSALSDIFNKGSLHGFNGFNDAQYRPIALLNFMIEVQLFGLNPHVSHFFNIVFYGITCVFVFLFLLKLTNEKFTPLMALTGALLFTFHPIHTEVVANIKSRDELLSFMFGVISFYYVFKYLTTQKKNNYILSILFFGLACFSKETGLMFGIIIAILLFFFSTKTIAEIIKTSLPYIGIMFLYVIIRSQVMTSITFNEKIIVMNNALMAAKTPMEMFATNMVHLGKYLFMLFIPYPLSWDYSYNQITLVNFSDWKALLSLTTYIGLIIYSAVNFFKKDFLAFSFVFFFLTLFLVSNLAVKIGATFGERFLFAPSLAFCFAFPLLVSQINKNVFQKSSKTLILIIPILLIYSSITIPRNKVWKNNFELFKSGVITSPNSARAQFSLASEYRTQAEISTNPQEKAAFYGKSVEYFKNGLKIYDKDPDAYYNLGVSYYGMGDFANAKEVYLKTLELNPKYTNALNNLGVISFNAKDYDKALEYFLKVEALDKNHSDAIANIGASYHNKGDLKNAILFYEKALKIKPSALNVYDNAIMACQKNGNKEKEIYFTQLKQKHSPIK
ncbi:MAG: tetratricopeptide repeat protein [Bacteroidetes bacterium]|nr:tetratricopeptide repeat protein [Bacteroidota bacterium]